LSGIPPKSLGKSLSSQVLSDDDRGQRGVHPLASVGSSPFTHTLAQLGEGDIRMVSPATDAVSRPENILQPTMCQARCREKEEHPLYCCPKYLGLSLGERWGFVLKRKLCQFCLGADHRHKQCYMESDYHYTLLREENPVDYKPTHVQEAMAASAGPPEAEAMPVHW
jgi:hypothetical protein